MLGSKEGFPTLHTATLSSWKALTYGEGSLGESVWSVLLLRRAPQIGTCGQPWILMPGLRGRMHTLEVSLNHTPPALLPDLGLHTGGASH